MSVDQVTALAIKASLSHCAIRVLLLVVGLAGTGFTYAQANEGPFDMAPDFTLPLIDQDKVVTLSDYRGKVVLVDFWASWCGPCRASMPDYDAMREEIQKSPGGENFEILAINVDMTSEDALAFLEEYPVNFPILREETGRSQQAYQLLGMPSTFLIDQLGQIRVAQQGYSQAFKRALKKEILRLLKQQ